MLFYVYLCIHFYLNVYIFENSLAKNNVYILFLGFVPLFDSIVVILRCMNTRQQHKSETIITPKFLSQKFSTTFLFFSSKFYFEVKVSPTLFHFQYTIQYQEIYLLLKKSNYIHHSISNYLSILYSKIKLDYNKKIYFRVKK